MKKLIPGFAFILLILALCVPAVFSQTGGSVKGAVKDVDGSPIADAQLVWSNVDNGQKYTVKTNKKGEYFSLGVSTGKYNITVYRNSEDMKANKEMYHLNNFQVALTENVLDIDLKKEQEAAAKGQGLTPEQLKQMQEQKEKQQKEATTVKNLNERIVAANTAIKAGDFESAITTLTEATQVDATRDIIWGQLADAYRGSAVKQTDKAERDRRLGEAVTDYLKAIDLKQKAVAAANKKDPEDNKRIAGYYNNLGDAYARSGKVDDAIKAYDQAAQINPEGAAGYYFNEGAVLTNSGKADAANAAFDKCIAADPNKAEAYYQKGVNLMAKATLQGDKTIPAPGTIESLQKYLEVAPNGPNAQNAKDLITSLGASVETSFGKKKPAAKTK